MIGSGDPAERNEASFVDPPEAHFMEAFCPGCRQAVDAVCPACRGHVEPAGASTDGAAQSELSRAEFYRRFVLMLQGARNSKFMLGCYLIATGDAFADGVSMTDFAKAWSVKKATVSKQCVFICRYLQIRPSRYMRRPETKASYRAANVRPQSVEGLTAKNTRKEKS